MSYIRSVGFSLLPLFVLIIASAAPIKAVADGHEYSFDKAHSAIKATYNHLGLSYQTLHFLDFDGSVAFDKEKPEETTAILTIKTASVTSHLPGFDKKLRGKDYFNAAKHPEISFKSKSAKRTGAATGKISGDLTINGIKKLVTFYVDYRFSGKHPLSNFVKKYKDMDAAGFSASAKILRSDFGMGAFTPLVSDEVEIRFEMELLKKAM